MATASPRSLFLAALEDTATQTSSQAMTFEAFARLPPELLPEILKHLRWRSGELARTCLVSRHWAQVSRPLIWEWVRSRDSERIAQAFTALSRNPELCLLVHDLEVRVFELATLSRLEALQDDVLRTLRCTKNLRNLVWTRKGSLRADIMDEICSLTCLERLELNATPAGGWTADQIQRLPKALKSISLLLPDREVIAYTLPSWLRSLDSGAGQGLTSFSAICLQSSVVNSTTLGAIIPFLSSLTSLTLHGCNKLRDEDVLRTLKTCKSLRHLALEAVSITPGFYLHAAPYLPNLESLRTSHPGRREVLVREYYAGLSQVVHSCPKFKSFTHYLSGDVERGLHTQVDPSFIESLVKCTGSRLVRFEVSGLSLAFESIRDVCVGAKGLEQLVVPVRTADLDDFRFYLINLTRLRSLHIVAAGTLALKVELSTMLDMVLHSSSTLRQIGVQNRVRSVGRKPTSRQALEASEVDPTAPAAIKNGMLVSLQPWDEPLGVWPEALLVVRT